MLRLSCVAKNLAEPGEGCFGIFEVERHAREAVGAQQSDEGRFPLILLRHEYLVVAEVGIQEAHQFATRGRVHELVYARERKVVFEACLVQAGEVYIDAPFASGLPYQDGVG